MEECVGYKGFSLRAVPRLSGGDWTVEVQVSIEGNPLSSAVIWGPGRTCPDRASAAREGIAFARRAIDLRLRDRPAHRA